jgi:4-aminobutyrate aminotransferase-like enzyme/Ser/Thr protein kinase RdoA (MazF antagonist)
MTAGDVLRAAPPRFTEQEASEIAARLFGAQGRAAALVSERDQNFAIGDGVLKISNAGEDPAILDMETEGVLHIKRVDPALPVALPRPLQGADAADGPEAYRSAVDGPDGSHLVRMVDRMPGRSSVSPASLDRTALPRLGAVAARLGRALRGFFHPAARRSLLWNVGNATLLRPLTSEVPEGGRALVARTLDRFEARVLPAWPTLRAQVTHGDPSLDNLLLDEGGTVTGVVDFGDMCHTALVTDLSTLLVSVLAGRDEADVFRVARLVLDGYASVTPLEETERSLIGDLLATRLATSVTVNAWRARRFPGNAAYIQGGDRESWALLEILDGVDPEEAARRLGAAGPPTRSVDLLVAKRRELLGSAISPLFYDRPLHLVRAEGVWVFDADGRPYLDAYNNVPTVGHSHPRVAETVARQTRTLATNARYLYEPLLELAERLARTMPEGLDTVLVLNSGTEANDVAWRLATASTRNTGGIVTEHAYHGTSSVTADLSPEEWAEDQRPAHVETFRPPVVGSSPEDFAAALDRLGGRGLAPAAVFVDGAFTSDGILTPSPEYVQDLVRQTHDAGALFVADEVQAGHGRTGEHLWCFESFGIVPDVVVLGKPMGNGYPVAALITRREILDRFSERYSFFSTYGGNPVAAGAALAVLEVIEDEGLIAHTAAIGGVLRRMLNDLRGRHPAIGEVRGRGLMIGVELLRESAPDTDLAGRVTNRMRDRGVLIGTTGPHDNVLKIRPPLVFETEHAEQLTEALDAALAMA